MAERWRIGEDAAGGRLDRFLAARTATPRNQVQAWLRDGRVSVNGRTAKPSQALVSGDEVLCERPPPVVEDPRVVPASGPLAVLFEDDSLVVLDKPAGLVVHPGAGRREGTLASRLLAHYPQLAGVGGLGRPGIVHRLDAGTSGAMVVAKTPAAYQALSRDFAARRVTKTYLAIVHGVPRATAGAIERPIGRHPERRKEMTVRADGRPALTSWRCLASAQRCALLAVDLGTGRTHQIRVHLKSIGHPLVGDPVYGEARHRGAPRGVQAALRDFPRPALHAWRLRFAHPEQAGETVDVVAPLPADFVDLWVSLAGSEPPLPAGC